jgi:hypothetical protein
MDMRKRSGNPRDVNEIAHSMIAALDSGNIPKTIDGKNPFAVALGRRGGLKGGPARAASLTRAERSESAKKAARARWSNKTP